MDRISLLASGCTALIVVFVLQSPSQFANSLSSYYWITGVRAASDNTVMEQDSPDLRKARGRAVVVAPEEQEPVAAEFHAPEVPEQIEIISPAPVQPAPAPPVNVVKDAVYLYALNHSDSAVVTTLPKGEVVEPQMQVNESGEEWSYVTAPGLRVSGYLQSDCLELR